MPRIPSSFHAVRRWRIGAVVVQPRGVHRPGGAGRSLFGVNLICCLIGGKPLVPWLKFGEL